MSVMTAAYAEVVNRTASEVPNCTEASSLTVFWHGWLQVVAGLQVRLLIRYLLHLMRTGGSGDARG